MAGLSAQSPCLQGALSRLFAALLSWVQAAGPCPAPDTQLGSPGLQVPPQLGTSSILKHNKGIQNHQHKKVTACLCCCLYI